MKKFSYVLALLMGIVIPVTAQELAPKDSTLLKQFELNFLAQRPIGQMNGFYFRSNEEMALYCAELTKNVLQADAFAPAAEDTLTATLAQCQNVLKKTPAQCPSAQAGKEAKEKADKTFLEWFSRGYQLQGEALASLHYTDGYLEMARGIANAYTDGYQHMADGYTNVSYTDGYREMAQGVAKTYTDGYQHMGKGYTNVSYTDGYREMAQGVAKTYTDGYQHIGKGYTNVSYTDGYRDLWNLIKKYFQSVCQSGENK